MAQPGSWDPAAPLPYGVAALLSTTLGCTMPDCATTQVAADQDMVPQQRSSSPLMRRVASAPALKVSSGQPSHNTSSSSSSDADAASKPNSGSNSTNSPAAEAAPSTCSSCGAEACRCLEVYVVSRAFSEFGGAVFNRLTPEMRRYMVDIGICHYMTVFRTPDGRLVQFDFGPQGGDVQKARGPLAALLRTARRQAAAAAATGTAATGDSALQGSGGRPAGGMVHSASLPALPVASLELSGAAAAADGMVGLLDGSRPPQPRGVVGEIRERHLEALPAAHLYVGRTQLSLDAIRCYNAAQRMQYELHANDCRHYVNNLVQYATGVERSTQHLKRHHYRSRHAGRWIPHGWFVETSQVLTDVGNWGHVKAGTAATLLAMTGRATLAHLKALSLPLLPLLKSVPLFAWAPGAAMTATAAVGGPSAAATLLLKRPLAAGGVAAASGAGAAAASGLGRGRQGEGGGQLGQGWGERLGSGIRAAAMALRRPGMGRPNPQQQQQAVESAPGVPRRGWFLPWGRRNQQQLQQQHHPQVILAAGGCVVGATPTMFLAPDTPGDVAPTVASSSSANSRPQRWRHNPFDWGSHVLWLGGHALRATSGLVAAAGRRVGLRQGLTQQQVPLTAAAFGAPGAPGSGNSTGHHTPRSSGRAVIGQQGLCFDPVWAAVGLQGGGLAGGSSSSSSSLRGGGARQTLHLPMPRLTWIAKNKRNMVA